MHRCSLERCCCAQLPTQELAVGGQRPGYLLFALPNELHPKAANAKRKESRHQGSGTLRQRVEDRVATAYVDDDGMFVTRIITQGDAVCLAGTATRLVIRAGAELTL